MAKVIFKRITDSADIGGVPILDGQLIYTKDGKTYLDYGNERIITGQGGGESGGDTLPINAIVDYDGSTVPEGWEQVDEIPVYSTTETICGTWINGKNIYRQVYTGNNLALNSNSWTETPVSIPGGSLIIEVKIINDENGQVMPLCGYTTSNNKLSVLNVRSGNVSYSLGYSLIVEYTKSTD